MNGSCAGMEKWGNVHIRYSYLVRVQRICMARLRRPALSLETGAGRAWYHYISSLVLVHLLALILVASTIAFIVVVPVHRQRETRIISTNEDDQTLWVVENTGVCMGH